MPALSIAGYVRMKLHNTRPGQTVRLLHGEDIKDGCFSQENINQTSIKVDAFQEITYICKGAVSEEYCPLFSIFGFRYVCLEGYDEEIRPKDFTAVAVYSDMPETVTYFESLSPSLFKTIILINSRRGRRTKTTKTEK